MCHELRTWRNPGREQDARRDLWQEFEETRRPAGDAGQEESPQPAQPEPAKEEVPARAGPRGRRVFIGRARNEDVRAQRRGLTPPLRVRECKI